MKFDKSRIKTNSVGYNYVKVTPGEILNWGGYCVCNGCNGQYLNEDMYLCFGLGDVYCESCFKSIEKRMSTYSKEDIEFDLALQRRSSEDWYRYHLDKDYRDGKIKNDCDEELDYTKFLEAFGIIDLNEASPIFDED